MQSSIWKFAAFGLFLVFCSRLPAEERPSLPSTTLVVPNLPSLAARSGYIFAGTVKAVERIKPHNKDSVAVMRITFHVQHGYRGVRTGQTVAIHEWAGLWQAGERYRPGEQVMLFLYPASKLGLTSPVPNGRFPVDSSGQIVVPSPGPPTPGPPTNGSPFPGSLAPPTTVPSAAGQLPQSLRISPQDFSWALERAEQE